MKRPEGFDPPGRRPVTPGPADKPAKPARTGRAQKPARPDKPVQVGKPARAPKSSTASTVSAGTSSQDTQQTERIEPLPKGSVKPMPGKSIQGKPMQGKPTVSKPTGKPTPGKPAADQHVRIPRDDDARSQVREARAAMRKARADLSRAARERRRFERGEVRRFTRRSRHRRIGWLVTGGIAVVLGVMLAIAVYSPILALREITVTGTSDSEAAEIRDAVDGQLGTPLALIDFDRLTNELGEFPLVRSYVTETVPPGTLIISVVEREPIGIVKSGKKWQTVDAAGVVIHESSSRPKGLPQIKVDDVSTDEPGFTSVVAVILALPDDLSGKVRSIEASTLDDVSFVLKGAGQKVVWGNAERSEFKARVLEGLIRNVGEDEDVTYDVTAPENPFYVEN